MHELWNLAMAIDKYSESIKITNHQTIINLHQALSVPTEQKPQEPSIVGDLLTFFIKSRISALMNDNEKMELERNQLIQTWSKNARQIIHPFPAYQHDFHSFVKQIPYIHKPTGFPDWLIRKVPMRQLA